MDPARVHLGDESLVKALRLDRFHRAVEAGSQSSAYLSDDGYLAEGEQVSADGGERACHLAGLSGKDAQADDLVDDVGDVLAGVFGRGPDEGDKPSLDGADDGAFDLDLRPANTLNDGPHR